MVTGWIEMADQILEEAQKGVKSVHLKLKRRPDFVALANALRTFHSVETITVTDYTSSDTQWRNRSHSHVNFFQALGSLPNLKTVRMEHFGNPYLRQRQRNRDYFPIDHLTTLLINHNNIESLDIEHLSAVGNHNDITQFHKAIRKQVSLRNFRMFLCRMVGPDNDDNTMCLTTYFVNQLAGALSSTQSLESVAIFLEQTHICFHPESMKALCDKPQPIRKLVLKGISLDSNCLKILARTLQTTPCSLNVLEFNLSNEYLGGGSVLVRSLRDNRSLKRLGITIGHNDGRFLVELAQTLQHNEFLKELYVTGVTSHSEQNFLAMLETNCALEVLHIQNCRYTYWKKMAFYLDLNQRGRDVSKFLTMTKSDWVDVFVRSKSDLNYLYYYMHANPLVCDSRQSFHQPYKRMRTESEYAAI